MRITTNGYTRVIAESFERSAPLIRRLLRDAGLSVAQEIRLSCAAYRFGIARCSCVVLLVDTPALLFECIALDPAGAVFAPIHVVVSGDHNTSYVHWADPTESSGLRPPAPARAPLERLCARVTDALSGLRD